MSIEILTTARRGRWLGRLAQDFGGPRALSLSLSGIPLVVLTFGIREFGSLLFNCNEMNGLARETMRCASVADTTPDGRTSRLDGQTVGFAKYSAATIATLTSQSLLFARFSIMDGKTLVANASMRRDVPPLELFFGGAASLVKTLNKHPKTDLHKNGIHLTGEGYDKARKILKTALSEVRCDHV